MVKYCMAVAFIMAAANLSAQEDSMRRWLDADLNFTTKKNFVFAAMQVKQDNHWLLYAVYPDTSLLLKVLYKDQALTIKDGAFALYHPKRVLAQQGSFTNNVAQGHWQSYYPNGQLKDEGDVRDNHFDGVWKSYYRNGKPQNMATYAYTKFDDGGQSVHENSPAKVQAVLGHVTLDGLKEGPAAAWYENGNKENEVNYHNDSLAGKCRWYRSNGQPSSVETYANGKVTELECYDSTGKYTGATCSIAKLPVLVHPTFDAVDYIEFELHKQKRKDISNYGEAQVTFTVTMSGAVKNVVITASPDPALTRHITEIMKTMPPWSPAVTHNRLVDYDMSITIPYYGD